MRALTITAQSYKIHKGIICKLYTYFKILDIPLLHKFSRIIHMAKKDLSLNLDT